MHENREISSVPADQSRSAKATSRTADTNVLEKSELTRNNHVGLERLTRKSVSRFGTRF